MAAHDFFKHTWPAWLLAMVSAALLYGVCFETPNGDKSMYIVKLNVDYPQDAVYPDVHGHGWINILGYCRNFTNWHHYKFCEGPMVGFNLKNSELVDGDISRGASDFNIIPQHMMFVLGVFHVLAMALAPIPALVGFAAGLRGSRFGLAAAPFNAVAAALASVFLLVAMIYDFLMVKEAKKHAAQWQSATVHAHQGATPWVVMLAWLMMMAATVLFSRAWYVSRQAKARAQSESARALTPPQTVYAGPSTSVAHAIVLHPAADFKGGDFKVDSEQGYLPEYDDSKVAEKAQMAEFEDKADLQRLSSGDSKASSIHEPLPRYEETPLETSATI